MGKMKKLLILVLVTFVLTSCTNQKASTQQIETLEKEIEQKDEEITQLQEENVGLNNQLSDIQADMDELNNQIATLEAQVQDNEVQQPQVITLLQTALTVMQLIKDQDMGSLSSYVHPTNGVRFSPYSYINVQDDLVFTATQISTIMSDTQVYTWGSYDGSGEPIQMTFGNYYGEFIYDQDFINPHLIGNNTVIGTGNSINNITTVYSNGEFVEFHFTGFDTQYSGMDWESLRLVFENVNGTYYLIGIIHDQWTI